MIEYVVVGVLLYMAWEMGKGPSGPSVGQVREERKRREKRNGAMADATVIKQKEIELQERGVSLPPREPSDPSLYDAKLDVLLEDSESLTENPTPTPFRFVQLEAPPSSCRTAGAKLMDKFYFEHSRSGVRPPTGDNE